MRNLVLKTLSATALFALPTIALAGDSGEDRPARGAVGTGMGRVSGGAASLPSRAGVMVEPRGSTARSSTTTNRTTGNTTGSSTTRQRTDR